MTLQGTPCWFELSTSDLAGAGRFYATILGWQITDSGMEGFTYHLARTGDGALVAGMMGPDAQPDGVAPNWLVYLAVDSADQAATRARAIGGAVLNPPADIPGTGRFAVLADPQGAAFGVLEPAPMEQPRPDGGGAWNQQKAGRGNWLELMSSDPEAGFAFYADLFGWQAGERLDMGEMGGYQLFTHDGATIGGMMGLGDAPLPVWLPYFGVDAPVSAVGDRIRAAGGRVHAGPHEVPGPAWIIVAQDPQQAWFAIVGAQR